MNQSCHIWKSNIAMLQSTLNYIWPAISKDYSFFSIKCCVPDCFVLYPNLFVFPFFFSWEKAKEQELLLRASQAEISCGNPLDFDSWLDLDIVMGRAGKSRARAGPG